MYFSRRRMAALLCRMALIGAGISASLTGSAQTATAGAGTGYDPRLTFAPLSLPEPVNSYRSSNGAPGPAYW